MKPLTVESLIKVLRTFPIDMPVIIPSNDGRSRYTFPLQGVKRKVFVYNKEVEGVVISDMVISPTNE